MRYNEFKLNEGALSFSHLRKRNNIDTFVNKIRGKQPHTLETGGTVILDPAEADRVEAVLKSDGRAPKGFSINDIDGNPVILGALTKTGEYGGQAAAAGEKLSKVPNKGNVTEGVLGAATTARLMKRPGSDITLDEVFKIIGSMPEAGGTGGVQEFPAKSGEITDKFNLTVRLDKPTYAAFRDVELLKSDPSMMKIAQQIVNYCNDARTVETYAKFFENNERPDVVEIVSDGITDNTGRKTDIYMVYLDENGERKIKHFDLSLKAGTTQQFGQAGGGASIHGTNEENFEKVKSMFETFGIDISNIKDGYLNSKTYAEGYGKAYSFAAKQFQQVLAGDDKDNEIKFIQKFIQGIRYHATLNDDNVKLLQFEENKFYLLDFKRLDRLYDNDKIDLDARYDVQGNGFPVLHIYNKKLNKSNVFMSFRPKPDNNRTKTVRNLIQKGPELKRLTTVRSTKKK